MKIMIIAGSNREGATSTALCRYIQNKLQNEEHEAVLYDLYRSPLPFYGKDPAIAADQAVQAYKQMALEADAFVLATPEYHGTISGVLKNALDHLGFDHFDSKAVLGVSSAGGAVGVSSLQELQVIVRNLHGINSSEWISIGGEDRTFDANGEPVSLKVKDRTHRVLAYFLKLAATVRG